MDICWNFRKIPELKHLDKRLQDEVLSATYGRRLRDPSLLLLIIPYVLIVSLSNFLGDRLLPFSYGGSVGGGLGAGLAIYLFFVFVFHRARPYMAAEIRRRSL